MDIEWLELPDASYMARVAMRLGLAAVLGGLVGAQRESQGKAAGLRTHMTVSLAAATFVLVALEATGDGGNLGRVIQGIAAGVGFLGAGTILKKSSDEDIQGLTTAATIWLTAAIGVAAGTGHGWMAFFVVVAAWLILSILQGTARLINPNNDSGHRKPRGH
jgi:putative Mg2+ transporter-C (MgtC) family protein